MKKILGFILGIMMCIGGFYCIMSPELAFLSLGTVFGITLLESAIAYFMIWFMTRNLPQRNTMLLANAILSLLAGIALLTNAFTQLYVESILLNVIALVMIARGITQIVNSFDMKKYLSTSKWILNLICGILVLITGIVALTNPIVLSLAIGLIIAMNIFTTGVSLIVLSLSI